MSGNLKSKLKRGSQEPLSSEKENHPMNISSMIGSKKGTKPSSPSTEGSKSRVFQGSPGIQGKNEVRRDIARTHFGVVGAVFSSDKDVLMSSAGSDRRKRSITPKTLKELLAEKRKKLSFSPLSGEPVKRLVAPRTAELLSSKQAKASILSATRPNTFHGGKDSTKSVPVVVPPSSPEPGQAIEDLLTTRNRELELCHKKGLLVTSMCINHPQKRSKFYVEEDDHVVQLDQPLDFLRGVCSKCAVRIANSGFHVEEIETEEEESLKCSELNHFIQRVRRVGSLTKLALRDNRNKQAAIEEHYERESEELLKLDGLAEELSALLQRGARELRECLAKDGQKELSKFKDIESKLKEHDKDVELFAENLGENFEETVRVMDLQSLQQNVTKFEEQLEVLINASKQSLDCKASVLKVARLERSFVKDLESRVKQIFRAKTEPLIVKEREEITKEIASLLSNKPPTSIKGEIASHDNVYVSFDASKMHFGQVHPLLQAAMANNHSNVDYLSSLDKIIGSQNEKNEYYESLSHGPADDPLFILSPTEADFGMKQTPELNQKETLPHYLREHLISLSKGATTGLESNICVGDTRQPQEYSTSQSKKPQQAKLDQSSLSQALSQQSDIDDLFNYIGKKSSMSPQQADRHIKQDSTLHGSRVEGSPSSPGLATGLSPLQGSAQNNNKSSANGSSGRTPNSVGDVLSAHLPSSSNNRKLGKCQKILFMEKPSTGNATGSSNGRQPRKSRLSESKEEDISDDPGLDEKLLGTK
jgi:hypothetical protein